MAGDDQIKFELDLDSSKFKEGIDAAKQTLSELSKSSQFIKGGLEFLQKYAIVLGAIYAAYRLISGAIETVFDAENIRAVNHQFDILAKNAGIAADKLRNDLVGAAGGLADDTDIIQAANKAIVSMGDSAGKLPEIMEMARKVTAAFGGDLTKNFETISTALATGNTRMLKQFGIIVDSDSALRDYAKSVGKATSELTDSEKRHVTMTAALSRSGEAFKGTNENIKESQNLWTQIKVTISQVGEIFTLALGKTIGPTVSSYLAGVREMTQDTHKFLQSWLGEGTDQAKAKIESLTDQITQMRGKIVEYETGQGTGIIGWVFGVKPEDEINHLKSRIAAAQVELDKWKSELNQPEDKPAGAPPAPKEADPAANQRKTQFESDLLKLKMRRLEFESASAMTVEEFDRKESERKAVALEQMNAEIMALEARDMNQKQRLIEIDQVRLQYEEQERQRIIETDQLRMQVYENQLRASQNTAEGTAAAFRQGSAQAQADLNNFGKQGQRVFQSFSNQSVNALQAFGAGTKTASEAAKGFLFGMLADEAEARGKLMMLASIWPFNPAGLAAGAGLVALSGYLRSQSGGKGSGMGGESSSGGGSGFQGGGGMGQGQSASGFEQQKKAVTVNVSGNYFDTDQTRMRMVEMIREATDATDFRYVQIGQS